LRLEFEAEQLRRQDANRRDIAVAWYTAMLSRSEKIPTLDKLLTNGQRRRQTPAEQRLVLQQLSAQYGIPLREVH
jgi:hypothetical protein